MRGYYGALMEKKCMKECSMFVLFQHSADISLSLGGE